MWDLPGPGIKPLSPLLTGRFLSTIPPGKSSPQIVIEYLFFPGHSLDTSLEYPLDKQSDKNSVTSRNWNMVEIEWRKGSIGFCWKKVCFTSQIPSNKKGRQTQTTLRLARHLFPNSSLHTLRLGSSHSLPSLREPYSSHLKNSHPNLHLSKS